MRSFRWYAHQLAALSAITGCVWLVAKLTGFIQ